MSSSKHIFIGTDSGATTSKINAVWENEEPVTTKLLQRPTNSQNGTGAVISGWIESIGIFLKENNLAWAQVKGVGLAIPGPYQRYGVKGGKLAWLSPAKAASSESDAAQSFKARVELNDKEITVKGQPRAFAAGMSGTAEIVVGKRTLISYVFEPIRQLRENLADAP